MDDDLARLRHSCAHVMAQAVKSLWPDVKLAIGPAIETGFYYDFEKDTPFSEEDLERIEEVMAGIIRRDLPFTQRRIPRSEAETLFLDAREDYKLALIARIPDEEVSLYYTGDEFVDLCRGPHVDRTGRIGAFKLLSVAGAYWEGKETNRMLQRIYGTCFFDVEDLRKFLHNLEEAKKRDHRKLGPQLDLFRIYQDAAGPGLVFYHPAGAMLRKIIEDYVREEHLRRGYDLVMTPHILRGRLWEQSGHADHYRENMYGFSVDGEDYAVKPMNCPAHILIYKSSLRSYRELPVRYFELGTVYRREKAGVLHGLLRVRGFTQDDAHIFCRQDQVKDEVVGVIDFVFAVMKDFGFTDLAVEVSTRPEKYIGALADWDLATRSLEEALHQRGIPYQINEGDGAFYGPKIDIKLKDALSRSWQCATIQCDFSLPRRFDLSYVGEDGSPGRPIMIHRAILGSLERFIGTLIEHYGGAFPLWLAPVQVCVIPIREGHREYASRVRFDLQEAGLRVIMDARHESLGKRIREQTMRKIPYLLIVGDREAQAGTAAVRRYGLGDVGTETVSLFVRHVQEEIAAKRTGLPDSGEPLRHETAG